MPDDVRGEAIAAIIRLADGCGPDAEATVRAYCSDSAVFAERKPRRLLFVDDIPKNAMGKVAKKTLLPLFDEE